MHRTMDINLRDTTGECSYDGHSYPGGYNPACELPSAHFSFFWWGHPSARRTPRGGNGREGGGIDKT